MLYSQTAFSRDQLLTDLIAAKEKLNRGWTKGSFQDGNNVCIVASAEMVTDQPIGFTRYGMSKLEDPNVMRLGRMIYALYVSLAGPKADPQTTLSSAMNYIAKFNDSRHSSLEAVNLLFDRAINLALAPAASDDNPSAEDYAEDDRIIAKAELTDQLGELVPA